jgi:Fe(3+) dicitrate transport protein
MWFILYLFIFVFSLSSQAKDSTKIESKVAKPVKVKEAKSEEKKPELAPKTESKVAEPLEVKDAKSDDKKSENAPNTESTVESPVKQEEAKTEEKKPESNPKKATEAGIEVRAQRDFSGIKHYDGVRGTSIYSGKKNEVLDLTKINANLALNNTRQVYAKIPGISIWENDGSGIQTGIATRGLSPNRMWEFNVRQNGYDIASDVFGYPEAYYTPPLEAVEKIEITRGAASLQNGPQFGGTINYVTKKADPNRAFAVETRQTGGSYNLFNSYNSVGGTSGKLSYFVFYHNRSGDAWRNNSKYKTQTGFINLSYQLTEKAKIGFEFTRSQYESQQAAGLQDGQYQYDPVMTTPTTNVNPRQSNRGRNWLSAPWNLPVLTFDYEFDEKTRMSIKSFGLVGERNSVGNVSAVNVPDLSRTGNTGFDIENSFAPRRIDRDFYRNYGNEIRFIKSYKIFGIENTSAAGIRYFVGNTNRIRNTNGTRGTAFTLSETNRVGDFVVRNAELNFRTVNYAAYYEHLFQFTSKFSITPGARYEFINSEVAGYTGIENLSRTATPISIDNRTSPFNMVRPQKLNNRVLLGGLGLQYKIFRDTNLYANYSQAFRPVLYQELYSPGTNVDDFDPNLKNQSGYNADTGYRGNIQNYLSFDVGLFQLKYNNRVGTISGRNRTDIPGVLQNPVPNLRTNTGDSLSRGVEAYVEYDPIAHLFEKTWWGTLSGFVSYAQVKAIYTTSKNPIAVNTTEFGRILLPDDGTFKDLGIVGNRVENAPDRITRTGITYTKKGIFSITLQNSKIAPIYSDANNTEYPILGNLNQTASGITSATPNGQVGKVNGYSVSDISFTYNITEILSLRGGINNIENRVYATRRAGGYPGPGLLPSDGRTAFLGLGAVF